MVLLLTDLKGFLEKVTVELEEVFNNTCAFPKINQLLMQYVGEMTAEIERMRGNAWLLCTSQQKTTLQRATTIPNSKKRLMNSCKCTMYLMPITLPSQPFKPCNLSMEESYIFFCLVKVLLHTVSSWACAHLQRSAPLSIVRVLWVGVPLCRCPLSMSYIHSSGPYFLMRFRHLHHPSLHTQSTICCHIWIQCY